MKQKTNPQATVMLVDDEPHILKTSRLILGSHGITDIVTFDDSREVLPYLATRSVAVIVFDLNMPYISGFELLPKLAKDFPQTPVILMTAVDDLETVINCMKEGAFDYLVKPVEMGRLVSSVRKALEIGNLSNELSSLKDRLLTDSLEHPSAFAEIVTGNKKMRATFQYIEVIAGSGKPVLITGDSGVGKELVAKAVHDLSGCKGNFIAVNVAGLDDNMFSDTLFGHKKGAFTGADQAREGLIARANGGSLFLDEIGDLNEMSQIKLLRLLQEKDYYPVGSDIARMSDARIILATNRDLQKQIAAGKFRRDLYYRLCTHQVTIPPLRERLDDIPLLLDHFIAQAASSLNKKKPTPPPELADLLSLHPFPGNLRELEAMVFDAVTRHSSGVLSMESFREVIFDDRPVLPRTETSTHSPENNPLIGIFGHFPSIEEVENHTIDEAMKMANGNQGIAANLLKMGRQNLNRRLKSRK
ncbi:MAG: sigma-54-dependent Fis family transcriptional regulator [Desulfuromonadales bacterium]|nr:sigma-54-dependent Fis family transcriptional regulator [Desulfuromonadales bacterium]